MSHLLYLSIVMFLVTISPGISQEVIYVFGDDMNYTVENSTLSEYNASGVICYTLNNGPESPLASEDNLGISCADAVALRKIFEDRMDFDKPVVLDEATHLAQEFPGKHSIDQVCAIYDHLRSNWNYTSDPTHKEHFRYANQTINLGRRDNLAGAGDCDDFAILMAAMVEGVGGSARVISSCGLMGGHAYAEVYLGRLGEDTWRLVNWTKKHYRVDDIRISVNPNTLEVWLNLDWYVRHPGGVQLPAVNRMPVYTRDVGRLVALNPPNEPPVAAIYFNPDMPKVGETVTFNGCMSTDDGKIELYKWYFGDGNNTTSEGCTSDHSYPVAGNYKVSLTVIDDKRASNRTTSTITINKPPSARFSFSPQEPVVNESVSFDASASDDGDGSIKYYEWDFGDGNILSKKANKVQTENTYSEIGTFIVNLTVTDDKNAADTISQKIDIRPRGAWIANINESDEVAQLMTVMGEYSPAGSKDNIWVFVKPIYDGKFWPQSENASIGDSARKGDGMWEMRISVGGHNDAELPFEISVGTTSFNADQSLKKMQKDWYENHSYPGLRILPEGVKITDRVNVTRSKDIFGRILNISNIHLQGSLNITKIGSEKIDLHADGNISRGFHVDPVTMISGRYTPDVGGSKVWVLLYSTNGRWYPQSIDALNGLHAEMRNGEWYGKFYCGGKSGDQFDLVVVLADAKADQILDEKQRQWASRLNDRGERGNFTGLLTIELPSGIDEKCRARVFLKESENSTPKVKPRLEITYPADNSTVMNDQNVSGIAKNIPNDGKELWLVAYEKSSGQYYPQETIQPNKINEKGEWMSRIYFNLPEEVKEFNLILMLTNSETFGDYFVELRRNSTFGLSKLPMGTKEYNRINLIRSNN
jgi:PKD repeat protein